MALHRPIRPQAADAVARDNWDLIVSHQLKTPLCALDARLSSEDALDRGTLRRDVRRMTRLIDQLHILGRCRNGEQVARRARPFGALARDVATELAPLACAANRAIVFRDLSGGAHVMADEVFAIEAMRNVIENAVKYAPSNGIVEVVVLASGAVCVLDRAATIPYAERSALYEPFRRGSSAARTEGSGLGLYLVREIMGLLGGGIRSRARQGGGNVFMLGFELAGSNDPAATVFQSVRRTPRRGRRMALV